MLASTDRRQDSPTCRLLARLGARLIAADRDPAYVFATGRTLASCPRCERWDALHVERDGTWRAACRCWGMPWRRLDRVDALAAVLKIETAP